MDRNQDCQSSLTCAACLEWRNSQQSVLRRANYKTATLRLVRNEFSELFVEVRDEKSNPKYHLIGITVHSKFMSEGKASINFQHENMVLLISNAPPAQLLMFLRSLYVKLAGKKQDSKIGMREKLLSKKSQVLQEISPLTLQEIKNAKAKSGVSTAEITPPSGSKRPHAADKTVKKKAGKKLCMTPIAAVALDPEQNEVLQAALRGQSLFFTGSAGTGKSYLLRRIIAALPPEVTVATASTGVAACHIGGITLHSFAGFLETFACHFCDNRTVKFKIHLDHHKYHSNLSRYFHCGYNGCKKNCQTEYSLRMHLIRSHKFRIKGGTTTNHTEFLQNSQAKYVCRVSMCKKEHDSYQMLQKHLKQHFKCGMTVPCPFHKCIRKYRNVNSFSSHLSKFHKNNIFIINSNDSSLPNTSEEEHVLSDKSIVSEETDVNYSSGSTVHNQDDIYLLNLAQLSLKLESEFLLPASTVQYLVSELQNVHSMGIDITKQNLYEQLVNEIISEGNAWQIVNRIALRDPFVAHYDDLSTNYKRKIFYKNNFTCVEPKQIYIQSVGGIKRYFHYVPTIETIKAIFQDNTLQSELSSPLRHEEHLFQDFTDGSAYKSNSFSQENPEALRLILYQDSFEVVNPIGAARVKHKILAIYLSVGNLRGYLRSHVNHIHLIALCKEKTFNHLQVYGQIVEDLKKIEDGVEVTGGVMVKGSVVFIAGDNLGSHSFGGFVENFSVRDYFCWYCLICRSNFMGSVTNNVAKNNEDINCESDFPNIEDDADNTTAENANNCNHSYNDSDTVTGNNNSILKKEIVDYRPVYCEMRTVESYNLALEKVGPGKHYQGIKFNSCFNQLAAYHVCKPGLPPCVGHDLHEGVVAYDCALFIRYFVDKEWFSYAMLNSRIESFKYSDYDQRDKPVKVPEKCKKIIGGAWQIWVFLRLLPLLVGHRIKDFNNEVWLSLPKLTEIVEIVCSPVIHISFVGYLQILIHEYLSLRKHLFPSTSLRAKHHYLTHYPELILQFGPLMKVFTLRFESKHTFFQEVYEVS